MKLFTLSIDKEIKVANTDRKQFDESVMELLEKDLLDSIDSLMGHEQPIEVLAQDLIDLKRGNVHLLDMAHDMDYDFRIKRVDI